MVMTTRKTLPEVISVLQHIFLLIILGNHLIDALHSGLGTGDEDSSPECHDNATLCHKDCCLKGEWFCHEAQEKCLHCDTRKSLCGNDKLPVECLLYCYKLQHPPLHGQDKTDSIYLSSDVFIPIMATMGVIILLQTAVITVVCVCARRRPPERWPACLRTALALNAQRRQHSEALKKKDRDTTDEKDPMLKQLENTNTKDITAKDSGTDLNGSSSSSSFRSNRSADVEGLNLTTVNDDDSNGRQHPPGDPLAAASSGNTRDTVGSCGGMTFPSAGRGQETTDDGITTAADNGRGNPPPQEPSWYCGGSRLPQHGSHGTNTEAGQEHAGSNGGIPPTHTMSPGRGMMTGQGPDARDIEVGSEDSCGRRPARDHNVSAEGTTPHVSRSAPPQPARQPHPQTPSALQTNEILCKPDFSKMNPTPEPDQRPVIATGTTNPAKNYVSQDLPSPQ